MTNSRPASPTQPLMAIRMPSSPTQPPMTNVFGALVLLVGAIGLSGGWAGTVAIAVLALAVLAPYGSMLATARRRLPPAVPAVTWLLLVVAAGFAPGAGGVTALRDALPRLLTAARPAPSTVEFLLPGVMLAVIVGVWVGARAVRGSRSRPRTLGAGSGTFAPLVGGAALYLAGALLTAGQADRYGALAALLVVTGVVGWAVTERRSSRRAGRLMTVVAGAGASVLAAGLLAVYLVPPDDAFEPRDLVEPPSTPLVARNPLPRLAALAGQDEVLFRHTVGERRLHLVALTIFDGTAWQSDALYRPLGAVAAPALPGGTSRTAVTGDVIIEGLDGFWLPAAGVPERVSLDARVDAESGSLVLDGGLRPGLRYQLRAMVDSPTADELAIAAVPTVATYRDTPRVPFLLADFARQTVQGAGTPFEQAVLLEATVRGNRRLDPRSPAGSSYARLETFLFAPASRPGGQSGTSEQFAGAFAVLARAVGLPTRVMFGFGPGQQQPDGTWAVSGRDALAWPEVYFTGLGWVPFDPSPAAPDTTGPSAEAKEQVFERIGLDPPEPQPTPSSRNRPTVQPTAPPAPGPAALPVPGDDPSSGRSVWAAPVVVAAAACLLMLARGLRTRRHRRAGAVGAWSEVLDLLVLVDRRPPPWHTAVRIADDVATAFPTRGTHPALRLAWAADRAAFCPRGVRVDVPWTQLRHLRAAVRRRTPWYRRLVWRLDPRPFWRR